MRSVIFVLFLIFPLILGAQETVSTPDIPAYTVSGVKVGQAVDFASGGAVSSLGHAVEYQFDWGDGTLSDWGAASQSHVYESNGFFLVKARARCASWALVLLGTCGGGVKATKSLSGN